MVGRELGREGPIAEGRNRGAEPPRIAERWWWLWLLDLYGWLWLSVVLGRLLGR